MRSSLFGASSPFVKLTQVRPVELIVATVPSREHAKERCVSFSHLSPSTASVYQIHREDAMQILYERCAGLDVHKKTVVACRLLSGPTGQLSKQVRTFSTTTVGLLQLGDWLAEEHVSHVAMESTGIYWRPVFNLLESRVEVILVNAHHIKAVPGRKTDVRDSEWLADLLRHGLLQASFIPPQPIRDLRDLVRYRTSLVQQRTAEINRLHKVLETANIKLSSVVSDLMGKSGRAMLKALREGISDPETLAELARGSLRGKLPQLREALSGQVDEHHRQLLDHQLAHLQFLEHRIQELSSQIQQRLSEYEQAVQLLLSLPAFQLTSAACVIAEIGVDMTRFASASHLASWAGLCPSNQQSAGRRGRGKILPGNARLKAALAEVVWALSHMKDNYLSAQYHRLARRIGKKRAVVAVSHSLLIIISHLLSKKVAYEDLGADYFEQRNKQREVQGAVRRLKHLGYTVTLAAQTPQEVSG